jgi:DNA-binding NtrC family response regulator
VVTGESASSALAKPDESPLNKSELVGRTVESVERELIIDTLNYCLGNRTHAANILGISIRTLRNKLKLYGEDAA